MVIEVYVGPVSDRFVGWCPMFPGIVCFADGAERAFSVAVNACSKILALKRTKDPSLPQPDLIDWVRRYGRPPKAFERALAEALAAPEIYLRPNQAEARA